MHAHLRTGPSLPSLQRRVCRGSGHTCTRPGVTLGRQGHEVQAILEHGQGSSWADRATRFRPD